MTSSTYGRPEFGMETELTAGSAVLRLSGEWDLASEPEFEEAVRRLPWIELREVALDLRDVTFLDSTAIRLMLKLARRSRADGLDLSVLVGNGAVLRTLDTAGVREMLPIIAAVPEDNGSKPAA